MTQLTHQFAKQRVLLREDLNVPMENGRVTNDQRLVAALPAIQQLCEAGAQVMILSHAGRPKEGEFDAALSLAPVAKRLSELLNKDVKLIAIDRQANAYVQTKLEDSEVVMLENVRFLQGEKANDASLAAQLASMADVFVMDAFAVAHREQASTVGLAEAMKAAGKTVMPGPLLEQEVQALNQVLESPDRPIVSIVGGIKISTKLALLESLLEKSDTVIVGGGIANTLLIANGHSIGRSLYEPELMDVAKRLLSDYNRTQLPLPIDVVVAKELKPGLQEGVDTTVKHISEVGDEDMILDMGPETNAQFAKLIRAAKTVLWNGPVGAFEIQPFHRGTQHLAQAIADSSAYSVAGGGDTLAAVDAFGVADKLSYISTGGGAFLAYVEGNPLPGLVCLEG